MTVDEAAALLAGAGIAAAGRWLDLGAGTGTFTLALARSVGHLGRVVAVDLDPAALRELDGAVASSGRDAAEVVTAVGDATDLDALGDAAAGPFTGVLAANVLHFLPRPALVLADAAGRLAPAGRIVVVEYDRVGANPWVPYPLPPAALGRAATEAALPAPTVVGTRPSRYGRTMYCAVIPVG